MVDPVLSTMSRRLSGSPSPTRSRRTPATSSGGGFPGTGIGPLDSASVTMTRTVSLAGAVLAAALCAPAVAHADDPNAVPQALLDTQCSLDQLMAATKVVDPVAYGEIVGKYNTAPRWVQGGVFYHMNLLLEKTPDQTPVPDETIYVPKKKVKAKKTKRVKAVSKASSNEEPEHKVVARKSTKKLVKSSSDTTPEIVETTGNSEAVLTTTDVVFSAETECPKNEHLSKEHSSRTIGRRLSSSPYTYAHKKKMTSRAMFKGKKLELRHSVQFSLPDDPNDKQPDLGPDGSYTYGLNGRGYRKLKCDQLPELVLFEAIGTVHEVKEQPATPEPAPLVANEIYDTASKILVYPETDLPGSPPIVLSHDGVWLHMLGRAAAIPDAVLEPHKFPAVKKYKVDDSEQLMIVPGYAFKVARFLVRDTLRSLRQKLGRDARHDELYAALDSIRLSDYADLLDVKHLCPAQVAESCGTQAPESCAPQDAESFMG